MIQASFHLGLFIQLFHVLQACVHKLMACVFLAASLAFFNSSLQVCHSSLCEMAFSFLCPLPQVFCSRDFSFSEVWPFHPKDSLLRGNGRGDCLFSPAHSYTWYLFCHLLAKPPEPAWGEMSMSRDFAGFS